MARLGYDRRAGRVWILTAWGLMLVCFFLMPKPGSLPADSILPVNINYVFGLSDAAPQPWMPAWAWLATMMIGLPVLAWLPAHWLLQKCFQPAPTGASPAGHQPGKAVRAIRQEAPFVHRDHAPVRIGGSETLTGPAHCR